MSKMEYRDEASVNGGKERGGQGKGIKGQSQPNVVYNPSERPTPRHSAFYVEKSEKNGETKQRSQESA